MHLLDLKFHIPIISDILSDLDISEPSLLDLFCWIAAVAYTVVYEIVHDSAPFPDKSVPIAGIHSEPFWVSRLPQRSFPITLEPLHTSGQRLKRLMRQPRRLFISACRSPERVRHPY